MNYKKLMAVVVASAGMMTAAITLGATLKQDYVMKFRVGQEDYVVNGTAKTMKNDLHCTPKIDSQTEKFLFPLRCVIENMNGSLSWKEENQSVVISCRNKNLKMKLGETKATLNGYDILLQDVPKQIDGRLYVTADFISDFFNTKIVWNNLKKETTLEIQTKPYPIIARNQLKQQEENRKYRVDFPVIVGLNDQSFEKNINHMLWNEAVKSVQNLGMNSQLDSCNQQAQWDRTIQMEVASCNPNFISLIFQGAQKDPAGETPLCYSKNIDLVGQQEIMVQDLFKNKEYLEQCLKKVGIEYENVAEELQKQFYITANEQLVLYIKDQKQNVYQYYTIDLTNCQEELNRKFSELVY